MTIPIHNDTILLSGDTRGEGSTSPKRGEAMEKPTRVSLLDSARKLMITEFDGAKADIPHYGERGAEVEKILIKWLENYLPKRFGVCSGFIIDDGDKISPQTDVIIYDALNSPVLRHSDKSLILPADNVAVAIEVKSRLTKDAFIDASNKIKEIKSLGKTPISDLDLVPNGARNIIQSQTMGVVFAFESDTSLETIAEWYVERFENGKHIDFVCILDKGWLELAAKMPGEDTVSTIMSTEALYKPTNVPGPIEIWIGIHKDIENILLNLIRIVLSYLQTFRNKIYIPYYSVFDYKKKEALARYIGSVTQGPLPKRKVQLVQKKKFKKKRK
jgi:hypothetical protein